jgi:hypothetical protein
VKNKYFGSLIIMLFLLTISLKVNAQVADYHTPYYGTLDPTHVYKIVNHATGQALEIGGNGTEQLASGRKADFWPYWGGANQQWYIQYHTSSGGLSWYTIVNRSSFKPLGFQSSMPIGSYVSQGNNETWRLDLRATGVNGDGFLQGSISPVESYGTQQLRYIGPEDNSNLVVVAGYVKQYLDIIDVSTNRGVYYITNANSYDILAADRDNNNVWQEYLTAANSTQEWSFSDYNSDGYLTIIARNTQQVLEIGGTGDVTLPGRVANVWNYTGGYNQQWRLIDNNDSHRLTVAEASDGRTFQIYNRQSGKVLEIGGNSDEQKKFHQRANQWYATGTLNQKWFLQYRSQNRGAAGPLATSTQGENDHLLSLYPNPVHNELTITLPEKAKATKVVVTDVRGSIAKIFCQGNGKVDLTNLVSGLYMLTVSDGQREYHQKFVKE